MNILILLVSLLSLVFAIPEKDYGSVWEQEALPHYDSMQKSSFQGQEGLQIAFSYLLKPNSTKTLVIIPGRTEPAAKYAELIYDFKDLNIDIFIMDHRGQGDSDRMLKDPLKSHVDKYSNYVSDLNRFIKIVTGISGKPIQLLAHSMGGATSALYLNEESSLVEKAILMSPMLEINTKPYGEKIASLISRLLRTVGQGNAYAPGYSSEIPELGEFSQNKFTHSEIRFAGTKHLYTTRPDLPVAGPTVRWVSESLKATKGIYKKRTKIPVLLFQASNDEIVNPGRQTKYCTDNCTLIKVEGAYHEILMEKDEMRDLAVARIRSFFGI